MIFSLNENRKLQLLMKCFLNEGLVMSDKEMKVFYKTKQLTVKTPERKLHLIWDIFCNFLVIFFNFQVLSGFQ